MPPDGVLRSQWQVGRYRVVLSQMVSAMSGTPSDTSPQWEPEKPKRLSKSEWREYQQGRNAHYQQLANIWYGPVIVVDDGKGRRRD